MNFPFEQNFSSLQDLDNIAKDFASSLTPSDIVSLNGDLGAGKTAFVKLICKYFQIFDVNSPTFAIVNEYSGDKKIFHFDFYRVKRVEELYDLGFEDYLNHDNAIIFIEWANLFNEILPSKHFDVQLTLKQDNTRTIRICKI